MKKNYFPLSILLLVIAVFFLTMSAMSDEKEEITQIQQAIKANGANWIAGENWVTKLSKEEQKRLCGTLLDKPDPSEVKFISLPEIENLPSKFDWRDNNGNWITPVTDQQQCGSCWDFSAVAQVEAWWKIHNANLDSMIDLSEQFVLSCSDGSCSGWSIGGALEFIRQNGVPTESCLGYQADDTVPCADACPDWQSESVTIPGWGYITLEEAVVNNIKNAVFRHPVSASYVVYEDFMSYAGGVYEHVWGDVVAGHAILIVGWDDEEQSWICKNSWGPNWGLKGYFRIKWGDSGMGSYSPFIWDDVISEPSLELSTNNIDLSLNVGDSVVEYVTLNNLSSKILEFSTADYEVSVDFRFHSDDFNSWDGNSWWCGDPDLGGYGDHWLQYLETPAIDLSATSAPKLSFMVNWSLEDPAGTDPPWDGWDGCNVWISVDGGETFSVATPVTPQYTCQSLWSFGHAEQGWNFGEGIAGWAGMSNGWQQAEFDLSSYKFENVIIRFALASDLAYSTIDNQALKGMFIDDIKISDGSKVLFENYGEDSDDMSQSGFGEEKLADWITVNHSGGTIQPNSSEQLAIEIVTKDLTPGKYGGKLIIISNDITKTFSEISLRMTLSAPPHDLAIEEVQLPAESIPILFPVNPGTKIFNAGLNDEAHFDVICTIENKGQLFYSDTAHVDLLLAGESTVIKFDPLLVTEPGELDFTISLINLNDDYNDYNNIIRSTTTVGNLVDNFETESEFWSFQDGWGRTDKIPGHTGKYCAHVSGGLFPYPHNLNTTMTFKPGFDLTSTDKATLKFWTRYVTEQDKDICYVEASGDSSNWVIMESFSGNNFITWTQHEVKLTDFITSGYDKVWVRFRFVSDDATSFVGILVDDVEIYPLNPTDVQNEEPARGIPEKWHLTQNYPNPFNANTNFTYSMPEAGEVSLTIYNINGKLVRNLIHRYQGAGSHTISWDGLNNNGEVVSSGVYLYQLHVKGKFFSTKKMILMK